MTRDRYPPGPAPEPMESPDSAEGRRPGLWASLKRAFVASDPPEETVPYLSEDAGSFEPAPEPGALPPAVPQPVSLEPPRAAAPASSPSPAPVDAGEAAQAAPGGPQTTAEPIAVAADSADASKPTRLARGLASFSRSNSEREKKFAHILRDKPSSTGKPGSGRRG